MKGLAVAGILESECKTKEKETGVTVRNSTKPAPRPFRNCFNVYMGNDVSTSAGKTSLLSHATNQGSGKPNQGKTDITIKPALIKSRRTTFLNEHKEG